ncbi:NAD(P)/FAD-dependent oxidoreductase [Hoeflea sp. TYP-13]|uniref:NAD(P)/FAD-dependent oxidoreductase n=1 Tax=Hoeflea sp. TYP-13 TaxID=3230023 RepID=UPI0034C688BD
MSLASDHPVTIIGGGIVGICCALSLAEKGVAVRIIDRDEPGQGASHGNAGVISPWSCVPQSMPGLWKNIPKWLLDPAGPVAVKPGHLFNVLPWAMRFLREGRADRVPAIAEAMDALVRPNVDLYRHHLSGTGQDDLLRNSWYVHVYRDARAADLNDLGWRLRTERGAPIEVIDANQLREIEPDLSTDYQAAILIKDQARALSPGRIGKALAEKVLSMGGEIVRSAVHNLRPVDGVWRIMTDDGELTAPRVVVAAGAWSARLLEPLGTRIDLQPERGYHLLFRDPGVRLNNSVMETDAKFVTSTMDTGLRSAGTAEFASLDATPNYRRARMLAKQTKRMLPGLNVEDTEEWMGIRPSLPDSLPCIAEVPGHRGLFAAFGHSHYGLGMAPMTGRVIADLVTDMQPNLDLAPYRIDRFSA